MMEGLHVFLFFQIPGKKGFKFHAQPQTGAYSCFGIKADYLCPNVVSYSSVVVFPLVRKSKGYLLHEGGAFRSHSS